MPINLLKELGSRCWYCGNTDPVHEKFPDYEVNACHSCLRLRRKKGLEEFRRLLGLRKMPGGKDLIGLKDAVTVRTDGQRQIIEEMVQQASAKIARHRFYFEDLTRDFSLETDGEDTKTWQLEAKRLTSADLLKELGSKCWYCGKLLCRYKEEWRDVEYVVGRGTVIEGRELERRTPYYGRPTHDNLADFTVNACPSCTARRHRKPIEEYRTWLAIRDMPEGKELRSLEAALEAGAPDEEDKRKIVEGMIQQLRSRTLGYRFYLEELIIYCGREWRNAS